MSDDSPFRRPSVLLQADHLDPVDGLAADELRLARWESIPVMECDWSSSLQPGLPLW